MKRRDFLAAVPAAALAGRLPATNWLNSEPQNGAPPFKLKYAPHLGMFRNHARDPIDQLRFMADQGFRALEDNGMANREVSRSTDHRSRPNSVTLFKTVQPFLRQLSA